MQRISRPPKHHNLRRVSISGIFLTPGGVSEAVA
jgi:hypothetical protein